MSAAVVAACALVLATAGCGHADAPSAVLLGTYLLDRDDYARGLLHERQAAATGPGHAAPSPQERQAWSEDARRSAAETDLRLDLVADGTFVVRFRFGSEEGRRRGTWRQEGDSLVLRTTHTPTGALAQPSEIRARHAPGELRFPASEDVPHAFLLRRR